MTQIKDLNSIAYDGAYFVPIQKSDGTTGKILISAIGGSLSAWQLKTSSYTAVAGDRLRIDATAGDVVITLPVSPTATDADILFQRLDLGTNKVLLRTGANKFNTQANQDAVFAPATINLIEGISYVNSAIGWLNQHNRLTFQAYTATIINGTNLVYSSDGDTNGLIYYLGTAKLTAAFANPQSNGSIATIASSTAFGSTQSLSDRISNEFDTNNISNSWIAFNITDNSKIAVSKYTIQNRSINSSQLLRSWVLEGTNTVTTFDVAGINAATWVLIDTRTNDMTLVNVDQYYTATVNGSTAPFKYLRFRQTGLNSSGADYLVLGELEFYGSLSI